MQYSLEEIMKEAVNGSMVWTEKKVMDVVRNQSNAIMSGYYSKKKSEFSELSYWLNEGYLDFRILEYEVAITDFRELKTFEASLKGEEFAAYSQIEESSNYFNDIQMKFSIWSWLKDKGATDIEIKKRNYGLYAKDLQIVVQTGDANVSHILESFRKGVKQYIISPYTTEKGGYMFILEKTTEMESYILKEQEEEEEIKKFFIRSRKKKLPPLPTANKDIAFKHTDLVEFKEGSKKLRGIVLVDIPIGKKGVATARAEFSEDKEDWIKTSRAEQSELDSALGLKDNRIKFKWKLDDEGYVEPRLLVKRPKKTSASVIMEYYAVKPEDIVTYTPIDVREMVDTIANTFSRNNDESLTLSLAEEDHFEANAFYEPENHRIVVSMYNAYQLVIQRFVHEGLSPSDTIEMLIAHEMGHADESSSHLYQEKYFESIDRMNEINEYVNDLWSGIVRRTAKKEVLEEVVGLLKEKAPMVDLYEQYVLSAEKDAFEHGLKYLPDYLHPVFEKENYELYLAYRKESKERLHHSREQLNFVLDLLPNYKQLESDFLSDLL